VDITTLEGLVIERWLNGLSGAGRKRMLRRLEANRRDQVRQRPSRCPFLSTTDTCRIYALRPFSCRRLYSLRACDADGPVIHKQALTIAETSIARLQQLDDTGYSGHISAVLALLRQKDFRRGYLGGRFAPQTVAAFGRRHGLVINRMLSPSASD
jgi:hypothetical protein